MNRKSYLTANKARSCDSHDCSICENGRLPRVLNKRAYPECRRKYLSRKLNPLRTCAGFLMLLIKLEHTIQKH